MSTDSLRRGALVLYKIHPAVVGEITEKIEIRLADGKSKRVRPKDVQLLHPGPLHSLDDLKAGDPAVDEAWELLEGEAVALPDLAELLYGDYSPASAWGAWELLNDGLYFVTDGELIRARDAQEVAAERMARDEKARAAREWAAFIDRVERAALKDEDRKRLAEVERVALAQTSASRVLAQFGVTATAEAAHRFLLRCGYWPAHENPWPRRVGVPLAPVEMGVPDLPEESRVDLSHLSAWAIDDAGNQDPDDAISIDGERLWVHVADVAALVRPGGHLDLAARERSANLYLPEAVHTMLPPTVTERLGLGLAERSPALSIGFGFDGDKVIDSEVVPSWVKVERASYDEIDARMDEPPFAAIADITDAYRAARSARGAARIELPEVSVRVIDDQVIIRPLPKIASRDMVTDAMLMAGEAAARFAQANAIPIPFALQPPPEELRQPQGMVEMYAYRRLFKPSRASLTPEPHAGLGLDLYTRATSPLRRYADLVVHQQLRAFATRRDCLSADEVAVRIASLDSAGALVRKAERLSNLHWKLIFLERSPDWQGDAVVVALEERKAVVMIPSLALETRIRLSPAVELGQTLRLAVQQVDVPAQTVHFRVLA